MQKVALEMHLSETAFLVPRDTSASYDLRWFTPTDEVDLCGHATLASAAVLWEVHGADPNVPLSFHTRSGVLTAVRDGEGCIELDFPSEPAQPVAAEPLIEPLIRAFGLSDADDIVWVGRNTIGGPGGGDLIVELTQEAFGRLRPVPGDICAPGSPLECRVLSVTCAGCPSSVPLPSDGPLSASYDFASRGFAPCVVCFQSLEPPASSLSPSLPHTLPACLPACRPPSLPPSLPVSLPPLPSSLSLSCSAAF